MDPKYYTQEQIDIITHNYVEGDVVLVDAKAGASKTTTIMGMCKHWQMHDVYDNILYLVYNSKMREEAEKKIRKEGLNDIVTVKTIHGLAYSFVGHKYSHKLGTNITKGDVKKVLHCGWNVAEDVQLELGEFFNNSKTHSSDLTQNSLKYLKKMINVDDMEVKMVHDCYLKLYSSQLKKKQDSALSYQVIFVDEAQDSNEITMDLVMNRISSNKTIKVFVGDPYQQIYSFRGSCNMMDMVESTKTFPLSKSFRFGKNIARISGRLISDQFDGNDDVKDKVYNHKEDYPALGTYISRTNAGVLSNAFELNNLGHKIHFLKGFNEYADDIVDICYLSMNQMYKVKSNKIKKFYNYEGYKKFVFKTKDSGMIGVKMVEEHGANYVLENIKKLKDTKVTIGKADVVVSNVHTSKGLEFDTVILGNDFMKLEKIGREEFEELNLLYVAMTRAKTKLYLNRDVSKEFGRSSSVSNY
jgi:F-box protein 18 (helicase)